MAFDSFQFVVFVSVFIAGLRFIRAPWLRELVICLSSTFFVLCFVDSLTEIIPLVLFITLAYLGILTVSIVKHKIIFSFLLTVLVIYFIWLKKYEAIASLPQLNFSYLVIGISYILFRSIHVVVDVYEGVIERPSPFRFFCYCLFFPTFVSGPILRYERYVEELHAPSKPLSILKFNSALARLLRGFLLLFVVGRLAREITMAIERAFYTAPQSALLEGSFLLAVAAILFLIYLYINFSGYMDIVVSIAELSGIHIPENFNRPWESKNFLDLWSRWHITLSEWFKFYIFTPITKGLSKLLGERSLLSAGIIAFFVTFLVMGLWHGTSSLFFFYGIFLGTGVVVNRLWQLGLVRLISKSGYRELCKFKSYVHISRGLALSYFAMSLVCIWVDVNQISKLASPHGIIGSILSFALLTTVISIISLASGIESSREISRSIYTIVFQRFNRTRWLVIGVFSVSTILLVLSGGTEEIVYKGF